MTKAQIAMLVERAESWPEEAQEELVRHSMDIERQRGLIYHLSDDERADVREGLAEIKRNKVASEKKTRETFKKLRGA